MPRSVAEETLEAVEAGRGNAREVLDGILAHRSLDPRDRDLAREIAYGALRRLSTLDHLLEAHSRPRLRGLHPRVTTTPFASCPSCFRPGLSSSPRSTPFHRRTSTASSPCSSSRPGSCVGR